MLSIWVSFSCYVVLSYKQIFISPIDTNTYRECLSLSLFFSCSRDHFNACDQQRCTLSEGWIELINIFWFTNNFIGSPVEWHILFDNNFIFHNFIYEICVFYSLVSIAFFFRSHFSFKFYGRLESWRDATNIFFLSLFHVRCCSFFHVCLIMNRNETRLSQTHTHTCKHMGYLLMSEIIFVTMKN